MVKIFDLNAPARIWIGTIYVVAQAALLSLISQELKPPVSVVLLLAMLVLVFVSTITGPFVAVLASILTALTINWNFVPPYYTLQIANSEHYTALIVFPIISGASAILISKVISFQMRIIESQTHAKLISTVVRPHESLRSTLERIRLELNLEALELNKPGGTSILSRNQGFQTDKSHRALEVTTSDGYTLTGYGSTKFAIDLDFVLNLANAAVRAYESEQVEFEIQRNSDLESINSLRSSLMASIGHDLRTPLATLRLAVENLNLETLSSEESSAIIEHIQISTHRLSDTLTNLLDMSRFDAGTLTVTRAEVFVEDLLNGLVHEFDDARIELILGKLIPIYTDAILLERILSNLISNALQHDESQSQVVVEAFMADDHIEIHISDNGPGFDPENSRRPTEGSRLGMQIVKNFSSLINADVSFVTNSVSRGTRVTVKLPIAM